MTVRRTRPLLTALTAGLVLLAGASIAQLVGTFIDEDFSLAFGIHSTSRELVNTFRSRRSYG